MNKKKLMLLVFTLCVMFGVISKVEAKEYIGFGTCSYNLISGHDDKGVFNDYIDDNIGSNNNYVLKFAFSEILADKNNLYVYTDYSDDRWYSVYTENGDQFSEDNFKNTGKTLATEFYTELNANGGNCPKYFIIKKDGKNGYSYFSNSIEQYCSGTNCPVIAEARTPSFYKVNANEIYWEYKNQDITTQIVIDNGTWKGKLLIPSNGKHWNDSAQNSSVTDNGIKYSVSTVDLKGKNEAGLMRAVESLVTQNKLSNLVYQPKSGKEEIGVNDVGLSGTGEIGLTDVAFSRVSSCKVIDDRAFSSLSGTFNSSLTTTYSTYSSLVTTNGSTSNLKTINFTAKTFDDVAEADISGLVTLFKSFDTDNSVNNAYTKYFDTISSYLENSCEASKEKAETAMDTLKSEKEAYDNFVTAVNLSKKNLEKRLEETNHASQAEELGNIDLDDNVENSKMVTTKAYTSVSHLTGFAGGRTVSSTDGCSMFSNEFKDFLNTILWYIKIAGVILAIILSLTDYIKSAAGSDEKAMGAANKRLLTRLILVAVLFLLPALLEFVLGTLNISTTAGSLTCLK